MMDGRIGVRYKSQRLTELVGGVVLRPYVPHGTKWIGEGEGDTLTDSRIISCICIVSVLFSRVAFKEAHKRSLLF